MATELEDRCPICLDSWEEASYVLPCLHRFCYRCIVRWAESKPECPLCKGRVTSILHSVRADDSFQEHIIPPPAAPPVVVRLRGRAPGQQAAGQSLHQRAAPQPPAARSLPTAPVGGFYACVWASVFRLYPTVLQPLMPWLQQALGQLLEDAQEAAAAQRLVVSSLRYFGLEEEALIPLLRPSLGRHTRSFVHRLVQTIVCRCSGEARHRMGLQDARAAQEQEGSPEDAPSPAASQEGSPAPGPALHGELGSSTPSASVPTHQEQEELQQDPEETAPGPSTRSRATQRPPGRRRQAPRRRLDSPEDSSQSHKRPRRHQ